LVETACFIRDQRTGFHDELQCGLDSFLYLLLDPD